VIILHNSYSSRTSHVHYIYMSHHACMISLYIISRLDFPVIVLNTANYISLLISMPYSCCDYIFHILSFIVLFPSCTLAGPLLTDHYYYFSVSRSISWYRVLIVDHILVLRWVQFFSWFVLFRYSGWYVHVLVFHICDFIPALGCICIYVCYPARCW